MPDCIKVGLYCQSCTCFSTLSLILLTLAVMLPANLTSAAGTFAEIGPCSGTNVQGTIVGVDVNGVVTIDTGSGLCTVTANGSYSHPIVTLLSKYFGEVQVNTFADTLKSLQGCAVDMGGGSYAWQACGTGETPNAQIVGVNPDGTFLVQINGVTDPVTLSISGLDPQTIQQMLDSLLVNWTLDGNGDLVQVSDQIAAYHDQGLGFGVLVKLYAIAEATGVPVEELVAQFQAGTGMGQLFKLYGKPSILGVGQVRQLLKGTSHKGKGNGNGNGNSNGNVNAKGKANGKGNGNGKGKGHGGKKR
jgi:hypothetical protein